MRRRLEQRPGVVCHAREFRITIQLRVIPRRLPMDTLIGLATSALRSVRMAVELAAVGVANAADAQSVGASPQPDGFIDFEKLRQPLDLSLSWYPDSQAESTAFEDR